MLYTLSRNEVERLQDASRGNLAGPGAALRAGGAQQRQQSDDAEALIEHLQDFSIDVQQVNRGLRIELTNAPGSAFVDGRIIEGIRELLSAVIRDLVYSTARSRPPAHRPRQRRRDHQRGVRDAAQCAGPCNPRSIRTWWSAGAAIRSRASEYEYTKDCGYQLGLRGHETS
jgi:pyrimidine/purine-5'-nucleotide nucleosidase